MAITKSVTISLAFFLFSVIFAKGASAIVNPLDYPNNRVGIHILDPVDLPVAQELVNSSGGDWGYVTFVIQENDRNIKKWQEVLNQMRRAHLIPIVRIASQHQDEGWKKLEVNDIDNWLYFLNSLNWVIKNRYVVVANEPNHADEWGGEVNPEEYANYFIEFSKKAKEASSDFFILPAALDASAPNNKKHQSEERFLETIKNTRPEYINQIDGLASHSYPNPDFSGSEQASGRGTIKTYEWELNLLKSLGVQKEYPVFITETGWKHNENGEILNKRSTSISEKYSHAFEKVWNDPRVVAITPFVLNYTQEPFATFSWKNKDGAFYPFFNTVKQIPKVKGAPYQENSGQILFLLYPSAVPQDSLTKAVALIKNNGQSIWEKEAVKINEIVDNKIVYSTPITQTVEPGEKVFITLNLYIPKAQGSLNGVIKLTKDSETFGNAYKFQVLAIKSFFFDSNPINNLKQYIFEDPINKLLREFKLKFW